MPADASSEKQRVCPRMGQLERQGAQQIVGNRTERKKTRENEKKTKESEEKTSEKR
ncbi:MAG: hypothetical protein WBF58_11435 [Xanthobacteraceae bacterium]